MVQKKVTVQNINGIHCRPSTHIYKAAVKFESDLQGEGADGSANLKSMIEIITLALHCGDDVMVSADGADEVEALAALTEAFVTHYDYAD
jgi:phosphocarrier protein HPr